MCLCVQLKYVYIYIYSVLQKSPREHKIFCHELQVVSALWFTLDTSHHLGILGIGLLCKTSQQARVMQCCWTITATTTQGTMQWIPCARSTKLSVIFLLPDFNEARRLQPHCMMLTSGFCMACTLPNVQARPSPGVKDRGHCHTRGEADISCQFRLKAERLEQPTPRQCHANATIPAIEASHRTARCVASPSALGSGSARIGPIFQYLNRWIHPSPCSSFPGTPRVSAFGRSDTSVPLLRSNSAAGTPTLLIPSLALLSFPGVLHFIGFIGALHWNTCETEYNANVQELHSASWLQWILTSVTFMEECFHVLGQSPVIDRIYWVFSHPIIEPKLIHVYYAC